VGVFLIFVVAGPAIAALLAIGILPLFGITSLAGDIEGLIHGIGTLMAVSYVMGGLQMAAIGLFAGIWHLVMRKPTISLLLILAVSLAVAAVAIIIFTQPFSMPAPHPAIVAAMVALHVGAAIGSALIANAFLRVQQTGALAA
jgi:hypothetical protein